MLPHQGSYEITDLKKGVFKPATKERLRILEWDMILQVEKHDEPHRPMAIEVCGQTGRGKLIVTEEERMIEEFSGVLGREMPTSSVVSSTTLREGDFLEITLHHGSKKRIYEREVKFMRVDPGDRGKVHET